MELLPVEKMQSRIIRWHSVCLDLDRQCLSVGSTVIAASQAEFGLLHLLLSRRNLPLTKDVIMGWLFGREHGRDPRQVDVFVARLRRSLASVGLDRLIVTVPGRGYAVLDDGGEAGLMEGRYGGRDLATVGC